MSNETTQGINDSNSFGPLSLEKLKEALEGLKSPLIDPVKYFYTDKITYGKILDGMMVDYRAYTPLALIPLIIDNDIEPGVIIYCEPGLYDIWKKLKHHPWVDKSMDLWKVAFVLFENEKQIKERPPTINLMDENYLQSELMSFWAKK